MKRFLGIVANPKPFTVYLASCGHKVELAINEQVVRYHYGEDGAQYEIEQTRAFNIEEQNFAGDFQDWAFFELFDLTYDPH